ncbi:MAG: hypothetical protein KF886_17990 [Candidatus Hydrogenedentes bacterium]|nr:hypothetical protein [Candidatus Hydrogenedentota bacterium]
MSNHAVTMAIRCCQFLNTKYVIVLYFAWYWTELDGRGFPFPSVVYGIGVCAVYFVIWLELNKFTSRRVVFGKGVGCSMGELGSALLILTHPAFYLAEDRGIWGVHEVFLYLWPVGYLVVLGFVIGMIVDRNEKLT